MSRRCVWRSAGGWSWWTWPTSVAYPVGVAQAPVDVSQPGVGGELGPARRLGSPPLVGGTVRVVGRWAAIGVGTAAGSSELVPRTETFAWVSFPCASLVLVEARTNLPTTSDKPVPGGQRFVQNREAERRSRTSRNLGWSHTRSGSGPTRAKVV
jgi:hypothetical protein